MRLSLPLQHFRLRGGSLLALIPLLAACSAPLSPADYKAYLADPANGLLQVQETNGATVTCSYRPTDLLILQENTAAGSLTPVQRDSLRRSYAGKTYCSLSLSRNNAEIENQFVTDPTAFAQALSYLNTGVAQDVFLVTSPRDSVPALASMYPRLYGTTGRSTVLLVFDTRRLAPERGFHLAFRGAALGLAPLRFAFSKSNLSNLPSLAFN